MRVSLSDLSTARRVGALGRLDLGGIAAMQQFGYDGDEAGCAGGLQA
jgi:hypothetical protein